MNKTKSNKSPLSEERRTHLTARSEQAKFNHKLRNLWKDGNWKEIFRLKGAQTAVVSASVTEVNTQADSNDFDMLTIEMYFGTATTTAVNTVLCTLLNKTYIQDTIAIGATENSSDFTEVTLNYPDLEYSALIL